MSRDPKFCNDYGDAADCAKEIDHKYDMDFSPAGKIFWCSVCGPKAQGMLALINRAAETRPEFIQDFRTAVDDATAQVTKQ